MTLAKSLQAGSVFSPAGGARLCESFLPRSFKIFPGFSQQPNQKNLVRRGEEATLNLFLHNWPCVCSLGWKTVFLKATKTLFLTWTKFHCCYCTPSQLWNLVSMPVMRMQKNKKKRFLVCRDDPGTLIRTSKCVVPCARMHLHNRTIITSDPLCELAPVWEITLSPCGMMWPWNYMRGSTSPAQDLLSVH